MWEHLKKNKMLWVISLLFFALCHGSMLLTDSVGIDTEAIIAYPDALAYSWQVTGRQGLLLLKKLMGFETFDPVFAGIGTILFMTLANVLWTGLFSAVSEKRNAWADLAFCMVISSSAILTEQFYFKLQAVEISLSFCLTAVALYGVYCFAAGRKKIGLLAAFPCMLIAFSAYQVMVALYLAGAFIVFFLYVLRNLEERPEKRPDTKGLWIYIGKCAVTFLIAFLIGQVITKIWFSRGSYLADQIYWTKESIGKCILNIIKHMLGVALGAQLYYCKTFSLYALLFLIFVFLIIRRKAKGTAGKLFLPLAAVAVLGSPFLMTALMGGQPVIRSQLVLPYILAFLAYITIVLAEEYADLVFGRGCFETSGGGKVRSGLRITFALLFLLTGFLQVKYTSLLNYSDQVRYAGDVRLAGEILADLREVQEAEPLPVVFIGARKAELNDSCIHGEIIGYSFFEWDTFARPYGYHSTKRILGFFTALGESYPLPAQEQINAALERSPEMTVWPKEGSILKENGYIIVKLGDTEYP